MPPCYAIFYLFPELSNLVKVTRPFLKCISKAKAAKLVRDLVDLFLEIDVESNNAAVSIKHLSLMVLQTDLLRLKTIHFLQHYELAFFCKKQIDMR